MLKVIYFLAVLFFPLLVCVHSTAGLLLHSQPSREEHAEGRRRGRDCDGEGASRARSHRHQEGTHCHQGENPAQNDSEVCYVCMIH